MTAVGWRLLAEAHIGGFTKGRIVAAVREARGAGAAERLGLAAFGPTCLSRCAARSGRWFRRSAEIALGAVGGDAGVAGHCPSNMAEARGFLGDCRVGVASGGAGGFDALYDKGARSAFTGTAAC